MDSRAVDALKIIRRELEQEIEADTGTLASMEKRIAELRAGISRRRDEAGRIDRALAVMTEDAPRSENRHSVG